MQNYSRYPIFVTHAMLCIFKQVFEYLRCFILLVRVQGVQGHHFRFKIRSTYTDLLKSSVRRLSTRSPKVLSSKLTPGQEIFLNKISDSITRLK